MSPELASPEPRTPGTPWVPEPPFAHEPTISTSRKLPPADRDFDIYEAVHIAGCSTRSQAELHHISQTRVRQIVRRVVEWLSEVIPPQAKIAREQEIHLARQIAADRFQHQYEQMTTFWNMTRESKYAGLRMRITTAHARLGAVGGLLNALAANAIEGIPVPAWQPELNREGEAPAEPTTKSQVGRDSPDPALPADPGLWDLYSYDDLTPEIVAALAAHGRPVHPNLLEYAKQHGRKWPRPDAEHKPEAQARDSIPERTDAATKAPPQSSALHPSSFRLHPSSPSPPIEDCSPADRNPAPAQSSSDSSAAESDSSVTACDHDPSQTSDVSLNECATSQHLLISSKDMSATELQITPNQPGATISKAPSPLSTAHCPLRAEPSRPVSL